LLTSFYSRPNQKTMGPGSFSFSGLIGK